MQVEVQLPNKDGRLLPGAYVQVAIKGKAAAEAGPGDAQAFLVPTNTLLFRKEGPRIAVAENGPRRLAPHHHRTRLRPHGGDRLGPEGRRCADPQSADSIEQGRR
ncbi:hypothetical protein GCM10023063_49690 [Arthrobacter methylotrophus]